MSPRGRRSESITLPPGNHPGLIRYNDTKKSFVDERHSSSLEKPVVSPIGIAVDSDSDISCDCDSLDTKHGDSDDTYDAYDDDSNSDSSSLRWSPLDASAA